MISRRNRFHGHGSLRYVYSHGEVVRGPMLSLKYCLNPKRTSYRLAVVVSKKVMKSAVGRNRLRRRLYEAVRVLSDKIDKPYDIVITVFNDQLMTLPSEDLTVMVRAQLKQAGIIAHAKTPVHDKISR